MDDPVFDQQEQLDVENFQGQCELRLLHELIILNPENGGSCNSP